jgi:DNA-binding Lrp family transcriptional regulator
MTGSFFSRNVDADVNVKHEQSRPDWPREEEALKAYVLIQIEPDREPIAETLRAMPEVISAQDLTGPFDAIVLARSDSTRDLTDQLVARIQHLPGVIRALSAPLIGSLGQTAAIRMGHPVRAA